MNSKHILAVGLNPAWQKTIVFEHLRLGEVNRAVTVTGHAGGKAVHVAAAANTAGTVATLLQFAGGATGKLLIADLDSRGIEHCSVATRARTRTCTTLLSRHDASMTELIEPAEPIRATELATLRQQVDARLPSCAMVTISGTYPPGVPPGCYADILQQCRQHGCLTILDAYKGITEALAVGVDILKINVMELSALTGESQPLDAAQACLQMGCRAVAVTAGQHPALLVTASGAWRLQLPQLANVINPLGAGDTTTGVLAAELVKAGVQRWLQDDILRQAFRRALAAASASCLEQAAARFEIRVVDQLATQIGITAL